jgi:hypothetical protein
MASIPVWNLSELSKKAGLDGPPTLYLATYRTQARTKLTYTGGLSSLQDQMVRHLRVCTIRAETPDSP